MEPKVSVVIPTYQRAALLEDVVRSVLDQPLEEIEVLVMDDGSTDDTASRMARIDDPRLVYERPGKLGVPEIVNAGIALSRAPYVMILHDHDRIDPALLTELAGALDRHPSAGFAFCGYVFYDAEMTHETERWLLDLPEFVPGERMLGEVLMPRINSPVLALSMVRRSALEGRLMDPAIGGCADVELWHRLAASGDVAYVGKPLIHVRGRDPSSQFSNAASTLELMENTLRAKRRFLKDLPTADALAIEAGWRGQIDRGAGYVMWKALEAGDAATFDAARATVRERGSSRGRTIAGLLAALPSGVSRGVLRVARGLHRRLRKGTL